MTTFLVAIVCLVIGAALGALVFSSRLSRATSELARARADHAALAETLARERLANESAVANLLGSFESLSQRAMSSALEQFNLHQQSAIQERDSKITLSLRPLEQQLSEYRRQIEALSLGQQNAVHEVATVSERLLEAQAASVQETRRLARILGRADQRGRWGELQLENVLSASGLVVNVDYTLQTTSTSSGRALRPDAVVRMPAGHSIAIDAKFPFDAYEQATSTEEPSTRAQYLSAHASALRSHVKALADKAYWEALESSPEFVVCFIPSDAALSAGFGADPSLQAYAARSRVLIVGPTSLLALLWSASVVLRAADATLNAKEILIQAETLIERVRLVAEPIAKMGDSLNQTLEYYNKMVRSVETRLLPAARTMKKLGAATHADIPELAVLDQRAVSSKTLSGSTPAPGLFDFVLDQEATDQGATE